MPRLSAVEHVSQYVHFSEELESLGDEALSKDAPSEVQLEQGKCLVSRPEFFTDLR